MPDGVLRRFASDPTGLGPLRRVSARAARLEAAGRCSAMTGAGPQREGGWLGVLLLLRALPEGP
eukprot:9095566-Alexandrium_andersonii.AAC.1